MKKEIKKRKKERNLKLHVQVELIEKNVEVQNNKKEEWKEDKYVEKIQESPQREKEKECLSYVLLFLHYMCVECWTWTNKASCFMDSILLIQYEKNSETAMMVQIDYRSRTTDIHYHVSRPFYVFIFDASLFFILLIHQFQQLSVFG